MVYTGKRGVHARWINFSVFENDLEKVYKSSRESEIKTKLVFRQ